MGPIRKGGRQGKLESKFWGLMPGRCCGYRGVRLVRIVAAMSHVSRRHHRTGGPGVQPERFFLALQVTWPPRFASLPSVPPSLGSYGGQAGTQTPATDAKGQGNAALPCRKNRWRGQPRRCGWQATVMNGRNVVRYIPAADAPSVAKAVKGYGRFMALAKRDADRVIPDTRKATLSARNTSGNGQTISIWMRFP